MNLHSAAVDGYVSYELYRKIKRIEMQLQRQPKYCPGCVARAKNRSTTKRRSSYWDNDGRRKEVGDGSVWDVNHDDDGGWKQQATRWEDGSGWDEDGRRKEVGGGSGCRDDDASGWMEVGEGSGWAVDRHDDGGARTTGWGDVGTDRKSTRLNSSHITRSRMPSSA